MTKRNYNVILKYKDYTIISYEKKHMGTEYVIARNFNAEEFSWDSASNNYAYSMESALATLLSRATLHNITYIKNMMLGIGDRIRIYRSNMVIPKVHDSIDKSGNFTIPSNCPICGEPTKIVKDNDSEVLMCTNDNCAGKLLGKLCHSVSKNALNIEGLSEATIQKFIDLGWLSSIRDIYYLYLHKMDIDIYFGHMCFDAKSLGANMNLIGKDAKVVIHTDDESVENKFKEDVNLWIVKKG